MSALGNTLSIIVPCYNEREALPRFYDAVCAAMTALPGVELELMLVDDGSSDGTLELMKELHARDGRVRFLSFSRNFGKEAALLAGFEHCTGELVAVMDADLQDPPELLGEMYRGIVQDGYDVVATRRSTRRGEPPVRSAFAHCFYWLINRLSTADIVDGARDFRMMRRSVRDAIVSMGEYNRFSKGIFGWVGFRTRWLSYENVERVAGSTKFSFWKLFKYSMEGILAFTTAPLALPLILGALLLVVALIAAIALCAGGGLTGAGGVGCLIAAVGGLQLLSIGIVGQYLGKLYLEGKRRPVYILRETESGRLG